MVRLMIDNVLVNFVDHVRHRDDAQLREASAAIVKLYEEIEAIEEPFEDQALLASELLEGRDWVIENVRDGHVNIIAENIPDLSQFDNIVLDDMDDIDVDTK